MELLEKIAIENALAELTFKCPFEHDPDEAQELENKIPPDHKNKSDILGRAIKSERIKETSVNEDYLVQAKQEKGGGTVKVEKIGFSPHHLIPGNEIWNNKNGAHPLLAWVHKNAEGSKVNGDIGYVNNSKYNGLDLPSHHKFSLIADWGVNEKIQYDYAKEAMEAAGSRQFHDAHKAYSDMVWNALVKISEKLKVVEKNGKCPEGRKNCPLENPEDNKYDPPYLVRDQLRQISKRLKGRLTKDRKSWQNPLVTSRFALMYSEDIKEKEAKEKLEKARALMGSPTQ